MVDAYDKEETFLSECDEDLRTALIAHFYATGEKKIDSDLSVRVATRYIYENADAVSWAETNAPIMIAKWIDKRTLESLPNVASLPFVMVKETPTAVIAKDLK